MFQYSQFLPANLHIGIFDKQLLFHSFLFLDKGKNNI